ncbi:MAG: class I SAM-dependent methyltransferase [Arenicella sp.]
MNADAVADYWDNNVANWKIASHLDSGSPDFFAEVERYRFDKLNYLPKVVDYSAYANKDVLDVGCGLGTDLSRFARGGANCTGIDLSSQAIALAEKNFKQRNLHAHFKQMDGEQLEFADNSFDFIYCHTVLHFTPHPQKMINEIKRVLKPGGTALLMTINRGSWLYFLHRVAGMKIDYMDAPVFHKFNYAEFDQLCSNLPKRTMVVERFPVRTEVHKGWKAIIYNRLFVDLYNALPQRLIGKTGYHLLAFAEKS